jgi:hypothetical protein
MEHAPTPFFFVVFTFGLTIEYIKELGGASIRVPTEFQIFKE